MKTLATVLALIAMFPQATTWRGSVVDGVALAEAGGVLSVRTGPAVDLWRDGARPLSGSYVVRATLRKVSGRQHEGYGIIFGGTNLGTDSARYSYVMVRGDGDLLVKKRDGAATPVVRDWTHYAGIHSDDRRSQAENVVEIGVTSALVTVKVNGSELARVPARELFTSGLAGLRVSHRMQVEVRGFEAR